MSQRDMMRLLVSKLGPDEDAVYRAYAAAEECGEVERHSNEYGLTGLEYANALYGDGARKGWMMADDPIRI
jgi:hypothetical protein